MANREQVKELRGKEPDWTLQMIADRVGISRERVRQILKSEGLRTKGTLRKKRVVSNIEIEFAPFMTYIEFYGENSFFGGEVDQRTCLTFSPKELVKYLDISLSYVYKYLEQGLIPTLRIGKLYRIPIKTFGEFLKSGGIKKYHIKPKNYIYREIKHLDSTDILDYVSASELEQVCLFINTFYRKRSS